MPSSFSAPANLNLSEPTSSIPSAEYSPMPTMFEAARANAAALMERTPFAIDDAKDDDEDTEEDTEGEEDDVMDEVCELFKSPEHY